MVTNVTQTSCFFTWLFHIASTPVDLSSDEYIPLQEVQRSHLSNGIKYSMSHLNNTQIGNKILGLNLARLGFGKHFCMLNGEVTITVTTFYWSVLNSA